MLHTSSDDIRAQFTIVDENMQPFSPSLLPHRRVLAGEREAQAIIGYGNVNASKTFQPDRWMNVTSRPVLNEQGAVLFAITILHDITERVLAEHRKDEFISMASHELKTPVTSLKGFSYVLQRRLTKQGDEQSLFYLSRMDAQIIKLTKLISELLDISKMQSGKLVFQQELFDLDTLVQETVVAVQATTSTHRLHIEGKTNIQIRGDKDHLGQVFINLLTNAIKYSPKADTVLVRLAKNQEQAIVSVQDFGIGIAEPHHQKIFERFYQVTDPEERTYPGLGIGLYISHEIVERHHGRMWVENSKKGHSSIFSVALPLSKGL
jgi:signal transduction histidine kinase